MPVETGISQNFVYNTGNHMSTAEWLSPEPLHPQNTFENFVVGDSNRLACIAARRVSESPGVLYNPLFIYGGVGLGKTHLLQAIESEIRRKKPSSRTRYLTAGNLVAELRKATYLGTIDELRAELSKVDVLLIDDVQLFTNHESAQEELVQLSDALYHNSRQLIFTSDRQLQRIHQLSDRLRTRFGWGLVVEIGPPDQETRQAFLRKKSTLLGVQVSDEVIQYLATYGGTDMRSLEGVLNRTAFSSGNNIVPLTIEIARATLERTGQFRPPTPEEIIEAVTSYYEVSTTELISPIREKRLVHARQVVIYLMHQEGHILRAIGGVLGGRDHSTILHGLRRITSELAVNPRRQSEIEEIRASIPSGPVGVAGVLESKQSPTARLREESKPTKQPSLSLYQQFLRAHRKGGFVRFSDSDIATPEYKHPGVATRLQRYLARLRREGDQSLLHLCLSTHLLNTLWGAGITTIDAVRRGVGDETLRELTTLGGVGHQEIARALSELDTARSGLTIKTE